MNPLIHLLMPLAVVLVAGQASAAASPATACAIAKNKAAAKKVLSDMKCWQKAFSAGSDTPDAECLSKAGTKLASAIAKAEEKGGCIVEGDGATIDTATDECVDSLVDLTPSGGGACYVGATSPQATPFNYAGYYGLEAADALCEATAGTGAHMCTYTELAAAEANGDLASIPDTTTFWLERDITLDVGGVPSPPGNGGNCNDWLFTGSHLADGEYVTFSGGVPTWHLDNDTYYDGFDTSHVIFGDLDCFGTRAIPCCIPCAP